MSSKTKKSKTETKTPEVAINSILNAAMEFMSEAGVDFHRGITKGVKAPYIQFDPDQVKICPTCGKFRIARQLDCPFCTLEI